MPKNVTRSRLSVSAKLLAFTFGNGLAVVVDRDTRKQLEEVESFHGSVAGVGPDGNDQKQENNNELYYGDEAEEDAPASEMNDGQIGEPSVVMFNISPEAAQAQAMAEHVDGGQSIGNVIPGTATRLHSYTCWWRAEERTLFTNQVWVEAGCYYGFTYFSGRAKRGKRAHSDCCVEVDDGAGRKKCRRQNLRRLPVTCPVYESGELASWTR
ncbi:unnamed protein product [Amoebophrya sp. A120]|nr:unnamed protein product [Amoebophrya sp. A120]|eukprot:GSA120T00000773001.1